ncbi:hypothetical protein F2P79_024844 [Pimephales promelas]|nr:hypothetical protein F2P79_024844 [Pimephales promelas]
MSGLASSSLVHSGRTATAYEGTRLNSEALRTVKNASLSERGQSLRKPAVFATFSHPMPRTCGSSQRRRPPSSALSAWDWNTQSSLLPTADVTSAERRPLSTMRARLEALKLPPPLTAHELLAAALYEERAAYSCADRG